MPLDMNKKSKSKKLGWIQYEIILMIILIVCISYAITYENITMVNNAISITEIGTISLLNDDTEIEAFRNKGRHIIEYSHESCEFITVYDINHNLQSIVMLDNVEPLYDIIDDLYDWLPIFNSTDKGSIDLSSNGVNLTINYEWVSYNACTKYLVVYGINGTSENLFTVFNITGYIAITLSFIMLIIFIYQKYHGIADKYKQLHEEIRKII